MPKIQPITFNVVRKSIDDVTFDIAWTTEFSPREVAAHAVFDCEVYLQNEGGAGDLDIRRRRVASIWVAAQRSPVEKKVQVKADRNFLNEDFEVFGVGDTTDEWHAEVILRPFRLVEETKRHSDTIRDEFQSPIS